MGNIKKVIMAMRMMRMRRNVMMRRRKTTITTYQNYTWQPLYPAIVPAPPLVTKPHVFFPFCDNHFDENNGKDHDDMDL